MPLPSTLEAVALATHAVKSPGLPHWEGRCPVCDQLGKVWIDAYSDGEATAFCLSGRCSALELREALGLSDSVEVQLATGTFLGTAASRSEIVLSHSQKIPGENAADAAATFGARVIGRDDLANLPVLEPLIADTISRRTLAFVSGPPGTGKSFLLLDWAARIATGTDWQGRHVDKGRVLYIAAEGAFGIHSRLLAWEEYGGVKIPSSGFRVFDDAVQIVDDEARRALVDHVATVDYALVVIDTLARCSVGLDENGPQDMGRFIAAADEIKSAMSNGTVVIVHHSSKAGAGLRGSSVLEGAADTVYTTGHAPAREGNGISLIRRKNKNGPEEDRHSFMLRTVGPSVILHPMDVDDDSADGFRNIYFRTWTWLQAAFGGGEQTFSRTEAHSVMKSVDEPDRVRDATFYRHFAVLLDMGLLIDESPEGTARPRYSVDTAKGYEFSIPMRARIYLTPCEEDIPDGPVFDITTEPADPRG